MLVAIVAVVAVLAGVALYIQGSETSAGQPPSGATSAAPDPIVQPPIDTDSSTSSGAGSTAPEDLSGGAGGPPSEPPPFAPPSSGAPPSASAPLPAPSASGSATPEQSPAASRQTSAPGASSGAGSAAPTPVAPRSTTPPAAAAGAAQPQQPAADAVDLDRLEIEIDRLSARAAAVDQALNVLQQEQARQGLGLRTDMVTRQVSMNTNLARAQEAAARGDGARAQRFRDLAAADVAALEKFLGR
jgi:hypothetical protein